MPKLIDLTKQRFGKLTVSHWMGPIAGTRAPWWCLCDCGGEKPVSSIDLRRGLVKSCGCLLRKPPGESCINFLIYQHKRGAARRDLAWELTKEQFVALIFQDCYYCGRPPSNATRISGHSSLTYNGVDRKSNSSGYTPNEVVPCCKFCQYAKSKLTDIEFIDLAHKISNKHQLQQG